MLNHGAALSFIHSFLMFFLFITETISFLSHTTETMVVLDPNLEQQVSDLTKEKMRMLSDSWTLDPLSPLFIHVHVPHA